MLENYYSRFAVKVNISPQPTSKFIDVDSIIGLGINIGKRPKGEAHSILRASKAHITQDWGNNLRIFIIRVQAKQKNCKI